MSTLPATLLGLGWILSFALLGELLVHTAALPVPGSVVGMILLAVAMRVGAVRGDGLRRAAGLLTGRMGLFFVPAGVAAATLGDVVRPVLGVIVLASLISMVAVLAVVARIARVDDDSARPAP